MNLSLTKDEFHETVMLYLLRLAEENKVELKDPENIVFSQEFDAFLRHILSRPLGKLRTSYFRVEPKTKLSSRRLDASMKNKDGVKLIV